MIELLNADVDIELIYKQSSPAVRELLRKAEDYDLLLLHKAALLAVRTYWGMRRKNGQDEVDHPAAIVWSLWSMGIRKQEILAAVMLHDLVEHGKKTIYFIRHEFGDEVAEIVFRLTRTEEKCDLDDATLERIFKYIAWYYREMKTRNSSRKYLTKNRLRLLTMLPAKYVKITGDYYVGIAELAACVVIKSFDKEDIFGDMAYSLPTRSQKIQIIEYEIFLALQCKDVRKDARHSEYLEILFAGRNQIEKHVSNVIYQLILRKKLDEAEAENLLLKKQVAEYENTLFCRLLLGLSKSIAKLFNQP